MRPRRTAHDEREPASPPDDLDQWMDLTIEAGKLHEALLPPASSWPRATFWAPQGLAKTFRLLSRLSQDHNVKLGGLAAAVLDVAEPGHGQPPAALHSPAHKAAAGLRAVMGAGPRPPTGAAHRPDARPNRRTGAGTRPARLTPCSRRRREACHPARLGMSVTHDAPQVTLSDRGSGCPSCRLQRGPPLSPPPAGC